MTGHRAPAHASANARQFAPDHRFIDSARVRQDITALGALISRVNTHTSKAIAHRDVNPEGSPAGLAVTWGESARGHAQEVAA